jgi:hypothetical protein
VALVGLHLVRLSIQYSVLSPMAESFKFGCVGHMVQYAQETALLSQNWGNKLTGINLRCILFTNSLTTYSRVMRLPQTLPSHPPILRPHVTCPIDPVHIFTTKSLHIILGDIKAGVNKVRRRSNMSNFPACYLRIGSPHGNVGGVQAETNMILLGFIKILCPRTAIWPIAALIFPD